jgi:hypothetical protein
MLVDGDRLPLFMSAGDDKLELSFISACAQASTDASDDVCAAALFVLGSLMSVAPGCEHIAHAFALRSPLLGPAACGLRVGVQSSVLFARVSRARCTSVAASLAPRLPAISSRFVRLNSSCAISSVMPLATAINGLACVYEQRVLAGCTADCPQWMLPSPKAAAGSLIVDLFQPLLHSPDAAASSNAACAILRSCRCDYVFLLYPSLFTARPSSTVTISIDCMRACCHSLLRLLAIPSATTGAVYHSIQHEFIVAEVVAAWSRLPSSTRIELLPVFVQVTPPCRALSVLSSRHALAGVVRMRLVPQRMGYGHVQRRLVV